MTLLRTEGLTVEFGGVRALDAVDLSFDAGGVVGLIGPNGGGKTTFIDAVTGMVTPSQGMVEFRGEDVTPLPPYERAQRGLIRTFQTLELFYDLSVEQNLAATAEPLPWWQFMVDAIRPSRSDAADQRVRSALDQLGLQDDRDRMPAELSHGRRRLVGVARALAADPSLLLLDEPAAGLDSNESQELGARLRSIADSGVTIFLVDHDMSLVLDICETIHVLDFGSLVATGTPDEIRNDPVVIAAYLGSSSDSP